MIHYRVHFLSKDNTTEKLREFTDLNDALIFWAQHGPERATIWQSNDAITEAARDKWSPLQNKADS